MKLIHFTNETQATEFVVLCDDDEQAETISDYTSDGSKVSYVGSLDRESGSESMLPTNRELTA